MKSITPPSVRALGVLAAAATAAVLLAGCAGSDSPDAAGARTAPPEPASGDQPLGVSGLIAAAQDGVLQVQGDDAQTSVRYTSDTTVSKTVTVDASTISVGDCVLAITGQDADAATTIRVTEASSDGTCAGFPGAPGGGTPHDAPEMPNGAPDGPRPSGAPDGARPSDAPDGARPSDAPDGARPSDAPDGARPSDAPGPAEGGTGAFGALTIGRVTAVTATSLTVEAARLEGAEASSSAATSSDVQIDADTVVSATVNGTTADVAVGVCVTATGEADTAGGFDATALVLSDPDEAGSCRTGMGFPGGRPGGQGGADD